MEDSLALEVTVVSSEASKPAKRSSGKGKLLSSVTRRKLPLLKDVIELSHPTDDGKVEDKVLCLCGLRLEEAQIPEAIHEEIALEGTSRKSLANVKSLMENTKSVQCSDCDSHMCERCYETFARGEQSVCDETEDEDFSEDDFGEEKSEQTEASEPLSFGSRIESKPLCDCGSKYECSAAAGKCELCRKVKCEQMLVCRMHKTEVWLCSDCVELKTSIAKASATLRKMKVETEKSQLLMDAVSAIPCHSCARDTRAKRAWKCRNLLPEAYAAKDASTHCVFCEGCYKQLCVLTQDVNDCKKQSDAVWVPKSSRMQESESDWFWPNSTLWRMFHPSNEKPIDPRSLKLVWCEFKAESGSLEAERLAYIQVKVNDVRVEEQLEIGRAICGVSLSVTLYWLFSKEDYGNYGASDYAPSWIPEVAFCGSKHSAEMKKESLAKRHLSAISMHEFFGGDAHSKMLAMAGNRRNVCRNLHLKRVVLYCVVGNTRLKDVCAVDESRQIFVVRSAKYSQYAEGTEESKDTEATDAMDDMYPLTFRVHSLQHSAIEDSGVVLEYIPMESDSSPPWTWFKNSKKLMLSLSNSGVLCLDEANSSMENQVFRLWHRTDGTVAMSCIGARHNHAICRGLKHKNEGGNVVKTALVCLVQSVGDDGGDDDGDDDYGAHFCLQVVDDDANSPRLPLCETQGFGLLNCYSVKMETEIMEPFELENYPFDFQDIPVRIRALNFDKLLPAFYGHSEDGDWVANGKEHFFMLTTAEAVDCGSLTIVNTVSEFVSSEWQKDELRILLKAKRNFGSSAITQASLLVALGALNLTVFAIDSGEVADRLAHACALLLAIIFVEVQKTPQLTLMDALKYYMIYTSIWVAMVCSSEESSNNTTDFYFYSISFVVALLIFSRIAYLRRTRERNKATMDSAQIEAVSMQFQALVQGTSTGHGAAAEKRGGKESVRIYNYVLKDN